MQKRLIAVLVCGSVAWCAELPVREVVLYKHGVGFFERAGSIPAGDSARLDFKTSEMNDVLKSLIINGKSERVSGLRYDSSVPLDEKLAEFPFRIEASQPLSGVLDQLKGARLEMQVGNEKVAGEIVAARVIAGEKDRAERQQLVMLVDSGDMRTFDLDAASSIRFTDPKVQTQFREYLSALTAARSKDKRSVYIDGTGTGSRDITASYIIPTPIWKSSYRLLFAETGEPVLEGWAIVDNTTGEDWTNVQMALVSGKPISFISELYSPRYIARQMAELPEEQAQKPVLFSGAVSDRGPESSNGAFGGVAAGNADYMKSKMVGSQSQSVEVQSMAPPPAPTALPINGRNFVGAQLSSVVQGATGIELADLFEYRIATPVTIKKNESAMLPFLQDKIKARKIVVYNQANSQEHPLNAAELTNSTAKTLDGGPITVYDGGGYVGEALVETVKANDKRIISYGVDLGTRVSTNLDSDSDEIREIHVNRGVMTTRFVNRNKTTYTVRNVDAKPKTLIIEQSFEPETEILSQKPSETTATEWRFEVKLGASADVKFPVARERVLAQSFMVANLTPDLLANYIREKNLSAAGRQALEEIAAMKRQIGVNSDESNRTREKISNVGQDEERVRKNLESLNHVSGQQDLVQKYASQLAKLEQQIATLRDHEGELTAKSAELNLALDDRITKMAF